MKFGTILADPPWEYTKTSRHSSLSGYSDVEYSPITTEDLCNLPVGDLAEDDSVLLLWTTFPFIGDALSVIKAWGFTYVTGLPWVKVTKTDPWHVQYGVGYWFRGAAELILIGKRKKSYRTNHVGLLSDRVGLLSENFKHSRKPDSIYELVETGDAPFPGPYLELFGRRDHANWTVIGNESPQTAGEDICHSLDRLIRGKAA